MRITFDPAKRDLTLLNRDLDFARAAEVFAGSHATEEADPGSDDLRFRTAGFLDGRFIVLIWTPRGRDRRIISMRHAHDRELARWRSKLG